MRQIHNGGKGVGGLLIGTGGGKTDAADGALVASAGCAGAGAKSAKVSGSGIFKDAASDELVRGYAFDGTIRAWQIVIPDFGTVEGPFQITSFELTGRHDAEIAFELSLDSAGELTFAAA